MAVSVPLGLRRRCAGVGARPSAECCGRSENSVSYAVGPAAPHNVSIRR